jgi:hypothetical protein
MYGPGGYKAVYFGERQVSEAHIASIFSIQFSLPPVIAGVLLGLFLVPEHGYDERIPPESLVFSETHGITSQIIKLFTTCIEFVFLSYVSYLVVLKIYKKQKQTPWS